MKVIALVPGTKEVKLADWPEPKIQTPTQVKMRVLEVGICGTDREEAAGGRADAPKGEKLLIIGHEVLAEVVQVGANVKSVKPNDLVVITVRRPCHQCPMCQKNCFDMCESGHYTERGIKEQHGFQAEFVVEEERYLFKVPASLRQIGVLTEPTTVVEKAIDHACRLQVARLPVDPDPKKWCAGKKVLVAGLGPVGLLAAMVLRLRGADVTGVDVVDPTSLRPRILEAMGGHYTRTLNGIKFDLILEAAGVPKLDFELIPHLGTHGVYALTGVPGNRPPISFDAATLMRTLVLENQLIFGSVNAGFAHFKQAILDLEAASIQWKGVIDELITSRTPYSQFDHVLQNRKPDEIKAVIQWKAIE